MSNIVKVIITDNIPKEIENAIRTFFNEHAAEIIQEKKEGFLEGLKEERISIAQCYMPNGNYSHGTHGTVITTIIIQQIY